jgi:hypothetical protein
MTDEEKAEAAEFVAERFYGAGETAAVMALLEDISRLRALVKSAEFASSSYAPDAFCPWCGRDNDDKRGHMDDCAAFAPDGAVR